MVVDPATNRLYVSDGYGNRRVLIVDANTGKYIGHFGAYGNNPVDDAGRRRPPGHGSPTIQSSKAASLRNPVHCVEDFERRQALRLRPGNRPHPVFDKSDPSLRQTVQQSRGRGRQMRFPGGAIHQRTHQHHRHRRFHELLHGIRPRAASTSADNANMTIYILNRSNLQELGRLRAQRPERPESSHYLHQVSVDSKGNIYTRGGRHRQTDPEVSPLYGSPRLQRKPDTPP